MEGKTQGLKTMCPLPLFKALFPILPNYIFPSHSTITSLPTFIFPLTHLLPLSRHSFTRLLFCDSSTFSHPSLIYCFFTHSSTTYLTQPVPFFGLVSLSPFSFPNLSHSPTASQSLLIHGIYSLTYPRSTSISLIHFLCSSLIHYFYPFIRPYLSFLPYPILFCHLTCKKIAGSKIVNQPTIEEGLRELCIGGRQQCFTPQCTKKHTILEEQVRMRSRDEILQGETG